MLTVWQNEIRRAPCGPNKAEAITHTAHPDRHNVRSGLKDERFNLLTQLTDEDRQDFLRLRKAVSSGKLNGLRRATDPPFHLIGVLAGH
eukprot:5673567-Alexandrium_andersonii.AAC.1